jgi:hypothetical protein
MHEKINESQNDIHKPSLAQKQTAPQMRGMN